MTEKWRNDTKNLAMTVAVKQEVDLDTAYAIIKAFLLEVRGRLENGKSVKIKGLGNFTIKKRNQRKKWDFAQQKVIEWGPEYIVKFRPSKNIRQKLRELEKKEKESKKK